VVRAGETGSRLITTVQIDTPTNGTLLLRRLTVTAGAGASVAVPTR